MTEIRRLEGAAIGAALPALADILVGCVRAGASVSFMNPLSREEALAWWEGVAADAAAGRLVLLAAYDGARLVGTAQLVPADKPNQPHRGDVCKVLVDPAARRRGAGAALMRALDEEARRLGLTLLVLDTASGAAERLYEGAGWTRVGVIPGFALWPDGGLCDTTFYYKRLEPDGPAAS